MKTESYKQLETVEVATFEDNFNICINVYVETKKDEDGNDVFVYDSYEFNCKQNAIDLDDVRANPMKYIHYNPAVTVDERLEAIEEAILEIMGGM